MPDLFINFDEKEIYIKTSGNHIQCSFNPITLRKAKIVYNFGLSECNRVNYFEQSIINLS